MKPSHLLLAALMCAQTLAQSSNLLSILASEAYSVFTSFTAVQPTGTTTASTASTSASSSASASLAALSSTSSTTPSSTPSASTAASSNTSNASQTGSAAAASATTAAVSDSSNSNHNRTVAIVLGTVLGALALGLLILVLLLLRRRRRHRQGLARNGYISPSSESTFEGHKTATSRVTPVERPNTPKRPESLHSRSQVRAPLMSEHANHDVPFPHAFQNSSSMPFIPGTDEARRSLYNSASGHTGTWFDATDGLSSHPVHRHDLNGSGMGAGLGGAAVGVGAAAAATRRPKHRGNRGSREAATPLEKSGPHPQHLDGPYPSRSPRRASMESAKRRSGSMSRNLEQSQLQSPSSSQGIVNTSSGTNHGPHEMSAMPTPPVAKDNINPLDNTMATHGYGSPAHVASTKSGNSPNLQSRSRSYPPLPPALTIPQANRVQPPRIPSRSPKRARFADKDTYHEPAAYEDTRSIKSSNISTPTQPSPWTPRGQTMSASTITTDGLVSPISPEDTTRGIDHGISLAPARANLVHIPRSRDPSPNPPPQSSARTSDPFIDETSKHPSGLVDAVQTHFTPNPPQPERPQQLYTLFPIGADHGRNTDSRNSRALTRKPVPTSTYNAAGNPAKENWWRGSGAHDVHLNDRQHEDSAWANNYSNPPR